MHLVFVKDVGGYNILKLKLAATTVPFIVITQTTTALLQSVGDYLRPVYNLAAGCVVKVIISYLLIPITAINIYGAVIGTLCGYIVTVILNMFQIKKVFSVKLNIYEILLKPAMASLIMLIFVVFTYNNVYNYTISNGISCITSIFVGAIIYIILIMVFLGYLL